MIDTCNVCDAHGTYDESEDRARVRCNVRKFSADSFTVWRCRDCRSLHRLENVELADYYSHYPFQSNELDFWKRAGYSNYLSRLTSQGVSKSDAILDYGCGSGAFVEYLRHQGYEHTYGYDEFTPKWNDASVLAAKYDVIIAQDVIEHVADPGKLLASFKEKLKEGGMLCIGTPNADRIDLRDTEENLLSLHAPYHLHILSESALRGLAARLNFNVAAAYFRFYYDTLTPTVNYRFLRNYVRAIDNMLDSAFEPPNVRAVLGTPSLWFYALFGYWFAPRSEMMLLFRN